MNTYLSGRVVMVTGAGQGVGRGVSLACAERGAAVVVTALSLNEAQPVVEAIHQAGGEALAVACDVTDTDQVRAAVAASVARFGHLDGVVHNACSRLSPISKPLDQVTAADWDDQVAVALFGTAHCAQAAFSALCRRQGAMVVLSSDAGINGTAHMPVYSAVKGAQRGLVKSLAREWGPRGVRVNAITPLAVTPALHTYLETNPEARDHLVNRASLRRMGDAQGDIGAVAAFLLGPDSAFVTGQTIVADGGALML